MKRSHIIVWFILLAVYSLALQGARGIWEPSEGRYVCVATEMMRMADWIHPHLHYETPHWTKPPLTYWAIASSVKYFGYTPFAARLPNALAFMFTILLVYGLGRTFVSHAPWLPALIYATFLFPFLASNIITTDSILTLFETAGMALLVKALWPNGRNSLRSCGILLGWAAFGLAFLTKGPPALTPLFGVLVFLFFARDKAKDTDFKPILGFLLFIVIGGAWYFRVIWEDPTLLSYYFSILRYFLSDETMLKVATGEQNRNPQWYGAIVIYLPTLILGTLPWTIHTWREIGRMTRNTWQGLRTKRLLNAQDLFLLLWIFMPLVIFFIARSRLALYILPLFVPISIITSRGFDVTRLKTRKMVIYLGLWCILLVALRGISAFLPMSSNNKPFADQIANIIPSKDFTEIAFVETSPYRGLSLYFNVDIERISLNQADTFQKEFIKDELGEPQDKRLWIVPEKISSQFLGMLREQNYEVRLLGKIKGKDTYELFIDL